MIALRAERAKQITMECAGDGTLKGGTKSEVPEGPAIRQSAAAHLHIAYLSEVGGEDPIRCET